MNKKDPAALSPALLHEAKPRAKRVNAPASAATAHAPPELFDADFEASVAAVADAFGKGDTNPPAAPAATALLFLRQARQDLENRNRALRRLSAHLEQQLQNLDAEQTRYEARFNTTPDAYVLTDTYGTIREANRAASLLLHISTTHLVGKPLVNLIALPDRPSLRRSLLTLRHDIQSTKPGMDEVVEFVRLIPRNKPPLEVMLRIAPHFDPQTGTVEHLQWLIRDISKRVRAETERYRLLIDAVEDYAIFLLDETGRITSWNRGAEKTFGWNADDALNQPFEFLFPPDCEINAQSELQQARQNGRYTESGWMVGQNGTRFWTEGVLIALPAGGTGENKRAGFAKILRDMTSARREAEELRAREARLSLALQAARASHWELNLLTGAKNWSEEYDAMAGIDRALTPPSMETWIDSIYPDDRAQAQERLNEAIASNTPVTSEFRVVPDINRPPRWILSLGLPISDAQGRVVRVTGIAFDNTERKETEAALEARVQERTRDLAQANAKIIEETTARQALMQKIVTAQEDERRYLSRELHDTMGQHLTAFSLNLRFLEDTITPDAAGKAHLARIKEIADELSHDLHRMAIDLRPTALDDLGLANALQSYVENWKDRVGIDATFGAAGFSLKRKRSEIPPFIETTLYRIAQESLNNVARHSGATRADVMLTRTSDHLVLVIEDNGHGFDPEPLLNTSELPAESQAEPVASPAPDELPSRQPSGKLGLRGMAERAKTVGGTFTIESEPGGSGTSVFVRVPL